MRTLIIIFEDFNTSLSKWQSKQKISWNTLYFENTITQLADLIDLCKTLYSKMKVTQLCPTLCDPMEYTVHGILQARILEWVAYPFSRGSSWPRNWTGICTAGRLFTNWAIKEAWYSKPAGYTCYSDAHGMFTEIDTILGHKINLNKF